jgi:ribosomal protein L37AE/L43A
LQEVPGIDLDAAMRTGTPDAVHLMWESFSSHNDEPFGEGMLSITTQGQPTYVTLEYRFNHSGSALQHMSFAAVETVNGVTGKRLRLVCPECKSHKSTIYFRHDVWKCRTCHGLLYRSQYKADVEPDYELHDRLTLESRRPRRPYERVAVYDREVKKAKDKLTRLGPIDDAQRHVSHPFAPITTSYYRGYPPD